VRKQTISPTVNPIIGMADDSNLITGNRNINNRQAVVISEICSVISDNAVGAIKEKP